MQLIELLLLCKYGSSGCYNKRQIIVLLCDPIENGVKKL